MKSGALEGYSVKLLKLLIIEIRNTQIYDGSAWYNKTWLCINTCYGHDPTLLVK